MKINFKLTLPLVIIFEALLSCKVAADELHYNNIIIGDRANGLGGAYTAISDDPSGLYHNPAGIVYSGRRNLSASVNAFNQNTTTYKNVFGNGKDYVRTSSVLLPNFFGITQPLGPGTFGFSYAVTNSINENQDSEFFNLGSTVDSFNFNINNTDTSYKVGPSYAYEINESLSIGVTIYAHIRTVERIINQFIDITNNEYEWSNSYTQLSENGINPIIGLMWSPFDSFSLGLSIRKTSILNTNIKSLSTCASNISEQSISQCQPLPLDPNDPASAFIDGTVRAPTRGSSSQNRELPLQVNLGAAYFASPYLLLSGDMAYYEATSTAEAVTNYSLGAEYYINDTWALRGGLYTNNTSASKINPVQVNQDDYINLTGISFSMSHFSRNSAITGGIGLNFGSGKAQILSGQTDIQELNISSTLIYISSSYSY